MVGEPTSPPHSQRHDFVSRAKMGVFGWRPLKRPESQKDVFATTRLVRVPRSQGHSRGRRRPSQNRAFSQKRLPVHRFGGISSYVLPGRAYQPGVVTKGGISPARIFHTGKCLSSLFALTGRSGSRGHGKEVGRLAGRGEKVLIAHRHHAKKKLRTSLMVLDY